MQNLSHLKPLNFGAFLSFTWIIFMDFIFAQPLNLYKKVGALQRLNFGALLSFNWIIFMDFIFAQPLNLYIHALINFADWQN